MYVLLFIGLLSGLPDDDVVNNAFKNYSYRSVSAAIDSVDIKNLSDFNKARVYNFKGYYTQEEGNASQCDCGGE